MNIYEIRSALNAAGSHFFDKKTLRFFGETMKSFGVRPIEWKTYVYRKLSEIGESDSPIFFWMPPILQKAVWEFVQAENGADLLLIDDRDPIYGKFYK